MTTAMNTRITVHEISMAAVTLVHANMNAILLTLCNVIQTCLINKNNSIKLNTYDCIYTLIFNLFYF